MSEAVIAEPSVDFSTKVSSHGSYKMSRVRPVENANPTLDTGSTQETLFEIPTGSKAINFSKCALSFQMNIAAATASTAHVLHTLGMACIDRIEIYTRNGAQRLAEINNFNDYHRAIAPYVTKHSDYKTNPTARGAAAAPPERGYNLFPSQADLSAVAGLHSRSGARPLAVPVAADVPYDEPQYVAGGAVDAAFQVKYCVPLKQMFHTLGALDQDVFFGENIMMAVHWAGTDRIGYKCDDPAADLAQSGAGSGLIDSAVTIVNPEIRLSTETNPDIIEALVSRARNGFSMRVPYVRTYSKNFNLAANGKGNHQIRLNRQFGSRLLNIYSALYAQGNTGITAQELNNNSDAKETDFQSQMNENRLQEYRVDNSDGQDYEILKSHGLLDKSVVSTQNAYAFNRVWVDSWRSGSMCEWPERDTDIDGYDLNEESVYQMDKDLVTGNYRHYLFAVTQREITVAPNGINIQ